MLEITKHEALISALSYLDSTYGIKETDYSLYGAEIKQFDEAQQFDYVSPRKDVHFKITLYTKLIIVLPGENVLESLTVWVEEKGNISSSTGTAPSVEGETETVSMKLTDEKKKILDDVDRIMRENLGEERGVDKEAGINDHLVITVTDSGYRILKGDPTYPVYQYEYIMESNNFSSYETGLETHGWSDVPEPGTLPESSGTVERIESLSEYIEKTL